MKRHQRSENNMSVPSSQRVPTRKNRRKEKSRTFKTRRASFETLEKRHLLAAQITAFTLMNDTGNPTDNQTEDAHVRVQMYNPTGFSHEFAAQFDLNMDGTVDKTVPLSSTATLLEYDLGPFINAGPITAKVRLKEYNYYTQQQLYTSWSTLNFVYTGDGIPDINVFGLVNDTGTPNDKITSDPRIKVAFGDGSAPQYVVEVDANNDGVKDLWSNSWPNNNAIFDLANLISPGQVLVKARVGAFSMQTGQYTFSGWDSFQFEYTGGSSGSTFKIDSLVLLQDTWIDGDKITSNPRVVLDFTVPSNVLGNVKVEFDTNGDGTVDANLNVAPDATVQFDPTSYISQGNINLKARVGVLNPQTLVTDYTAWSTLNYVYTTVFEPKLIVSLGSTALTNHSGMIAFGTAILNEPVEKVLTIKNDGLAQLTLDLNSFSATTGFSIPSLPNATLAAGASTQVTVRMNATTLGAKSGTLSFNSNDPNATFFDLSLAGEVVNSENAAPKIVNQLVDVLATAGQTVSVDISGVFSSSSTLSYSLVSISNPVLVSGSLQGTTLTLNAGAISGNSNITIRATTPNGLFTEDVFILNIVQAGQSANQTVTIDLSNGRTAQQIETELRSVIQNANANGFRTNILFTLGNQDRVIELAQASPIEILTHVKFFGPTDGYALTIKRVAGDQRVFTVAPNAKAEFSDLTIRGGRRAMGDGAGIWNAGELTLNRVTLYDNVATSGYGAGLFNASLATATLGNVTISGNQTQKWGAGIFNRGTLSADNVTFASNTAERGAAFFNEGTMNLFASLIADGVDGSHPHTELAVGTVISRGFNVVTNAYGTTGFSTSLDKLGGISGLPLINPGLRPLQNNGGASLTHALIANSPAIDIVSTTANDTLDQRGAPRIINTREQWIQSHRADAGAYEFGAFFVNVNADGTDLSTAGDGIADSNSTLAGDQISLRSAISEANELTRFNANLNISYDQAATYIYFHPSVQPTLSLPGSAENGNLTGDLDILGNVVLIGQGTTKTIVRADYRDAQGTAVPDRVFHIHPNISVRMESIRLRDGRADIGGGIFTDGATVELNDMLVGGPGGLYGIGGNAATLKGGGIYQKAGSLHLVDSSVINNISLEGGGVYVESGTVVIEDDSHIDGNWAEVSGGGIAQIGGTIRVSASTIQDNSMLELLSIPNSTSTDSKRRGAGIYTMGASFILESESLLKNNKGATLGSGLFSNSTVQILSGSIISNNGGQLQGSSIVSSQGGGIFNLGALSLVDSKVEKNLGHEGAGIYNLTPGTLDVIRSSVSENNLDVYPLTAGAGIYNQNGITTIESSTVSKNEGVHDAGGVYNYGLNAHLIISNSTFQGNWAVTTGGGVRNDSGTVEVYNSLFLENYTPYASSGFGGGIYHRGQNVLLGRLASKIELYAAVNTTQTSLHVNNVDSLLPLPLPINVRLNSEVMRIVAIDRVKGTVQVERTAGQTHSVTTPLELVDYIGLRELDTLGNNKFPLDIVIDNEVMRATSIIPGTNWVAVERGRQNTEIESHDTGALVHGISGSLTIANSTFSDNFSGVGGTSSDITNYGGVIHSQIHPYVRPTVIESSTLVGNHRAETTAIFTEMLREDFPGKVLTPSGSFLQLNPVPKESTGVIPVWKSITDTLYLSNSVIADGSDKAIMGQVQSGGNNVVDQDKAQAIPILGTISSTATTIELDSYLPTLEKTLASTLYWTPNIVARYFPFQNPTSAQLPFKIKVSHTQIDSAGNAITVSETMRVTNVSGSLLTVERGIDGTTAVAHTGKVTAKINASGLWKSTDMVGAENQIEMSATTLLAPGGLTATADLIQIADSSRLPPVPFDVKVSYIVDNELLWEEMAVTEVVGNYLRVTRDSGVTHPHLSKVVVFSTLQLSIDAKIQALTQTATDLYTHIPNADSPAAKPTTATVQAAPLQSGLAADYHPSFDIFLSTSTLSGNYTLSTTLDSESTTLFLKETGLSLSLPVFAKLDQEIIRLVQYSSATQSYVIERGLQGTQKKPHQANSRVTLGTLISADATDTSFSADLTSSLPPVPFIVAIGGELMNVTAVNAETGIVQVQRGQFGSTRATHPPLRRASTELTLNTEVIMSVTLGNNLGKASPLYRPWKATLTAEVNAQSQYIMVDSPPAAFEDYVAIDGEIFSVIRVPSDANKLRIISRGAFGSPTKNHNAGKMVEAGVVLALDPAVDATITAGSIVTRDGESMIVSAVFDDAMIVTRGALGTKAIDHPVSGSFNFGSSVDADDQYLLVRDSSTIKSFPTIAMVGNERILILEDLGYGILRVQRGIHGTTANPIISGMKAASGTLIQVGSSKLEIGSTIQVAQEQLQVRGIHSSTGLAVVERGTNGTLPASHQAGTFVHFGSASRPIALAGLSTALTAPVIQATQTSLTVGGRGEFPVVPFFAALGNERIRVDAVVRNSDGTATLQTVRNLDGNVGTAYAAGTNLVLLVDQNQWNRLKKATDPIYASPEIGSIATSRFVVNTTTDIADLSPGDGVVTTSVPGAVSLRAAIMEANALSQPVEIRLSGATYTLTSELEIRGDITLIGTSPTGTILHGNGQRIFKVLPNARLKLDSLTLTGGNSSTQGGAMLITGGSTEINRTIFSSNSANSGGAIAITAGSLSIAQSTFMNNTASTDGGALASLGGQTTLSYTTFSANTATGKGGAIYNATTGDLELRNATLAYNQSASGAGIHNLGKAKVGNSIIANQAYGQTDIKGTFTSLGSNIIGLTSSDVMLTSFVSSTSTTISLSNTQSLPAVPFSLRIGNETMTATSQSGSTFTVQRTNPLSHSPYQNVRVDGFWQTGDQTGSGYTSIDPKLQPLALGMGTVPTHALQSNSPAINAGNAALRLSQEVTIAEDETTEFAGFQRDFKVIKVTEAATLPATPFFVQIGTETLEVIARKGNTLTVKERKFPQPHARGAVVKVLTDARGLPSHNDIGAVELETTISLSTANASLTEDTSGVGSQFTYTITRGGNVVDRHEIYFVVNPSPNSRITPNDFGSDAFPSGKVIFEPGATSASFNISIASDTIVEPNEAFTVSILSPSAQVRKLVSSVTSTIVDNDTASVTTTAVTAVEGESLRYTVTLQGTVQGGFQLPWSLGASGDLATLVDNDYIASSGVLNFVGTQGEKQYIEAITLQDQKVERHESLSVTIGSNLGVAPEMVSRISVPATLAGTIQNDDRTTIYISEVSKTELNSGSASVSSGFTVWPNPVDTSLPLTLQVTSSNATLGSDYSVTTSTLTLPGTIGTQSSNVVSIVGDSTLETDEVVQIAATLTDRSAWSSFISVVSGKVTIVDDDGPTLAISDVIASESNSAGYIEFQVQLLNNNGNPLTIDLRTKNGTAIAGEDYQQTTRTLSFSGTSGETLTFQVPLLAENLVERDEWLTLEPVDPIALSLAGIRLRSGVGTIRNDDVADIVISPPISIQEKAWLFEVRLSNPVDVPVTVTMSSTDIMASPTNHFTSSTTTFNLMTTSDVGRLVVDYHPQSEVGRNIQVAPVNVVSSGRAVNLPQSQNATIPVHQAIVGACRPLNVDPLSPPPTLQFSGPVPSGYTFSYEINGFLVYVKPSGRTVASYEQDKIAHFRELHDGRLQDETGFIWDRFEMVNGNYHLSNWAEFPVSKNPPPAGQPNPPGCPGEPPTTSDEEIDEELLKKELAKSDVKADWVIPHNQTFTFSPFPSFDYNKASDVAVTITDSNNNLVKVGASAELTYGTITVNADNTLTYTPKLDLTTSSQNRLKPEVDNFGNVYRFTGIEGFTAHLVSPQYIAAGSTATTVERFASTPITLAVSNTLPTVRGTNLRQSQEADQTDDIFIERNTTLQVDLESLYSDLDGTPDLSRIKVVDVTYNQEKLNNPSGNQQDPHPTQIRIPIATNGQSGTNEIQRSLIVSRTPEAGGPKPLLLIQNEVDSEMISGSFPKRITLTVHLTDGTTMEVTKDDGTKEVVPFVWKLNLNVVPHVDQTVSLWRNQPSIPVLETTPWVKKVSPSILERYKAETKETQPNRFEVTATVPTLDAAFQYDTIGDVSVNLFNGTLLRSHELILDGSGGTSEMALGGLVYDSSTVPAASPSEQPNNFVVAKFKKSSDQVLNSLTFKLKWYDDQGLIETNVSVAATILSQQEILVALRPGRVPTKTGLYSWEVETRAEYAVAAENLPVEIQIARGQSPVVVVGENSNFGAGWALAGMPTLTLSKGFDLAGGVNNKSLDDRFLLHFPGSPPALFNAASLALTTSYEGAFDSIEYGSLGIGATIRQRGEYGSLTSRAQGAEIVYRSADGTEYVFARVSDTFNLVRIEPPGVVFSSLTWNNSTTRRGLTFTWENPGNGVPSRLKSIVSSDGVETTLTYDTLNHVSKISRDTKYQVALTYNTNRLEEIKNLASGSATSTVQTLRHFDYNPQGQLIADQWWDLRPTTPKLDAKTSFGYEGSFLREVQVGSAFSGTSFGLAPHKIEPALSRIAMHAKSAVEFYSESYQQIDDLQKLKTAYPLAVEGASTNYQTKNLYSLDGLLIKSTSTVNGADALINTWSYTPQGDVSRSLNSKGQTSYFWYDYQSPYAINSTTDPSTEQDKSPTYDQNDFFGNVTVALSLQGLNYFYYETDDETDSALGGLIGTNANPSIQGTTQKIKGGPFFQADTQYALLNDGRTWLSQAVRGSKDATPTAPNQAILAPPAEIPEQDAIEISQFDANGFLEKQIDVNGLETTFTYVNRRLKTIKTFDKKSWDQLITSYEYDTFGFLDTITVSRDWHDDYLNKTDYDYDAFGNLLRVEKTVWNDPDHPNDATIAGRTTYTYNSLGQLIRQGETIALATFLIPELLLVSEYVYNDAGLLQQSTIGKNAGFLPQFGNFVDLQQVTTYSYYKDGSLKSETLPSGVEVRYLSAPAERKSWTVTSGVAGASTIDSTGHVQMKLDQYSITETVVDVFGRTVSEANLLTGASTHFIYGDPRTDSPTTIKQRVVNSTTGPSQERETRVQYDSSGRALWQKTNLLAATTTSYDQLGNVAWATTLNAKAATSHYKTLPNGQVANVTEFYLDGLGSLSLFVTSFEYDESGRILRTIDPLMGTSYSNGALLGQEPNTTPATITYERNGPLTRITSKTRDGAESITWQNSLGQTLKTMNPLGAKTTFEYDVRGQLIASELSPKEESTNNSDPGVQGYKTSNVFDALGRLRISTVTSDGNVLQSSYTDYLPPSAAWTVVTTDGKTGLTTASKVDSLGQTVAVLGANGSGSKDTAYPSTLSLLSYTYNGASGKTTTVHTNTIGSELTSSTSTSAPSTPINYTYLLEERHITNSSGDLLSSEVKYGNSTSYQPVQSMIYDLAGRPVSQTQYGVTTNLDYDNSKSGSDQVWSSSTVGVDPTYRRYDSRGQQTWVSDSHEFNSPDTIRWSYDALGRVTSESVLNGNKEVPRLWTYEGNSVVYTNRNGWTTTTTTDIANKTITETSTHPTNGPQNTPLTFSQVTELYSTGSIAGLSNKEGTTPLADYQYTYDALGRIRSQTSELGMVSGKTLSFDYLYSSYNPTEKTWESTRTIKENGTELITTKNIANALGQITKIRETATPAGRLNSKSVDFLFNGEMLEEIKRYNNGSGTGTAVSNTPIKYNANRKVSEIGHYADGVLHNMSYQEIYYTPDGKVEEVGNSAGENPARSFTYARNFNGSVGKLTTSTAGGSGTQQAKETIYNSDGIVSGEKEALGQISEDGNGRYLYDAEGNVIEHQRFKTPNNGAMKIAAESSFHEDEDGNRIYSRYVNTNNSPTGIATGNYRLYLTPLRIESPILLSNVTITVSIIESIPWAIDSTFFTETYTVSVVKIADDTYAVVEPRNWDLTIPSAQNNFYFKFNLELNDYGLTGTFKVLGSLSLDHFDVKHTYQYDAKNRIIEARQTSTGNNTPSTLSTTHYKYDALGQMISRKVEMPGDITDDSTFVYEQGNLVLEYDDLDRLERVSMYAQNLDLLLATDDLDFESNGTVTNAETVWVLSDYQGTVTGLYVSESRYDRIAYDEFGRPPENTSHGLDESLLYEIVRFGYMGMYYDIDTYVYSDGARPYDAASGRYITAGSFGSGVNFVYSFAGNTPVDRTTAAVNHDRNSTVPSFGSVFATEFLNEADVSGQWERGNYGTAILYGTGQLMAAVGTAGLGGLGLGAFFGVSAGASLVGVSAAATSNIIGTALSSNGEASYGQYMVGIGLSALGAINPTASVVGLGTGIVGAGIGAAFDNAAAGFYIGEMAGSIAAGGRADYVRALGKYAMRGGAAAQAAARLHAAAHIGVESGFTIAGGIDGYMSSGTLDGAVQGAVIGNMIGGVTAGFTVACFTAGTPLVIDFEGNSKPIEEIQEGDWVLARSEFDTQGPLELKRVEEKFVRTAAVMELVIQGQAIKTTAEHPFYVPAQERFVPAGELQVGDQLVSSQGVLVTIESISNLNEITTVYNLRVADHHTYFVGGALWGWDVWVHNAYKVLTGKAPEVPAFGTSTYVWNGRVRTRTQGVLSWTETNSRGKTVSKFVDGIESGENNARKNVPGINALFSKLDDPNWYHVEAQAIAIINRERGIRTATLRVNNRICPDCLGETMAYRLRKGATLEIIDPNGNVHRIQGRGPARGSY